MSKRKCFHLNCTALLYATVPATSHIIDSFDYYLKKEILVIPMLVIVQAVLVSIFKALTDSEESN